MESIELANIHSVKQLVAFTLFITNANASYFVIHFVFFYLYFFVYSLISIPSNPKIEKYIYFFFRTQKMLEISCFFFIREHATLMEFVWIISDSEFYFWKIMNVMMHERAREKRKNKINKFKIISNKNFILKNMNSNN